VKTFSTAAASGPLAELLLVGWLVVAVPDVLELQPATASPAAYRIARITAALRITAP